MLYIDAATFLFSFLTLTLFVPSRPPQPQTDDARGVFAGLRFLLRDPLLWRIGLAAIFLNMFGSMMSAALPVLAFDDFDESSRVAGALFASLGAGALFGMVLAVKLMPRFKPLKLAAIGIVALSLPIWLLGLDLPLWATLAALFASTIPQPLVNAPVIGLMTTRTPEALRPKLMTAVLTIAMLAGPDRARRRRPAAPGLRHAHGVRDHRGRDDGLRAVLRLGRTPLRASRRARGVCGSGLKPYGDASRAHRFSSIRRTVVTIALPPKSIAPPANTRAPAGVS